MSQHGEYFQPNEDDEEEDDDDEEEDDEPEKAKKTAAPVIAPAPFLFLNGRAAYAANGMLCREGHEEYIYERVEDLVQNAYEEMKGGGAFVEVAMYQFVELRKFRVKRVVEEVK